MQKFKLTKRFVEALPAGEKDRIVFAADLAGVGVRVMPSGRRFFLVQYRFEGRTRRIMIGQFGPITAELARVKALKLLGEARSGGDPARLRDAIRHSMTLKELGEHFFIRHVSIRLKPSTQSEYQRSVELYLRPFFAGQKIRTISRADVSRFHGSLSHIPYQANRSLAVLSKMMNLAELWGFREPKTNPCDDIKRYPERKRERFLSARELTMLGEALVAAEAGRWGSPYAIAAYRLLLLTGCRLSEIQTLKWAFVDFDQSELRLPDSKTGPKTVYLGSAAVSILRQIPQVKGNPYVIVGRWPCSHLSDLQQPWGKVREAAGLGNVRIHDLRHTFASGGVNSGENLPVLAKLLGHSRIQTTSRYAHVAADPIRQAAQRISDKISTDLRLQV